MANVIITIITSLPPASTTTPVVFTVVGGSGVPIRLAWASVAFPGIIGDEVIHNGERFGAFYVNAANTRVSILNGYQYTILRDGGWPIGGFPLTGSFTINAVDTLGNGTIALASQAVWVLIGDSNTVGQMDTDHADRGFNVTTPNLGVTYTARYANGTTDPPTFIDLPTGALRPRGPGGASGAGMELTFGGTLALAVSVGNSPWLGMLGMSGSTLATEWLPTASFMLVSTGTNLFNTMIAYVRSLLAASGRLFGGFVVNLGTNDAANSTNANNFDTNMTAFIVAARAALGPAVAFVWIKTHVGGASAFTSTVRTKEDVVAAGGDPLLTLLNVDDNVLSDGFHFDANSYLTIGQRSGFAMLRMYGFQQATPSALSIVGYGVVFGGNADLSVRSWPGCRHGDLEVLHVSTGFAAGSIATPSGWTAVASVDSTSTGLTVHNAVFTRAVTQTLLDANGGRMPTTTFVHSNTDNAAKTYTIRGPSLFPVVDTSATLAANVFGTGPVSVPGVTTATDGELVMRFAGAFCGTTGTQAFSDPGVPGSVEVQDTFWNEPSGNFILLVMSAGIKAAFGPVGAASWSASFNSIPGMITLAVRNP